MKSLRCENIYLNPKPENLAVSIDQFFILFFLSICIPDNFYCQIFCMKNFMLPDDRITSRERKSYFLIGCLKKEEYIIALVRSGTTWLEVGLSVFMSYLASVPLHGDPACLVLAFVPNYFLKDICITALEDRYYFSPG